MYIKNAPLKKIILVTWKRFSSANLSF
uniref:Uncharacterized protein n=1 Tax=Nelumbo nucifera TaxID=4432 RepID=A0A822XFJ9_NELNU|nr:TPA_asm: hypothetical protein HUJ06_019334 [Nelumbo nucifera]